MEFRCAVAKDVPYVARLYESVKYTGFCVWDEEYPTQTDATQDMRAECLFVLEDQGQIIGACSIVPEHEMDHLPCWTSPHATSAEIGRIVLDRRFQGRGLAKHMVRALLEETARRGFAYVRISVEKNNAPALATYGSLGFDKVGEAPMYGAFYCLMEKKLG